MSDTFEKLTMMADEKIFLLAIILLICLQGSK